MAELAGNKPRRLTARFVVAAAMAVASPVLGLAAILIWAGLTDEWTPMLTLSPQSAVTFTFPAVGAFLIHHRPRLNMAWLMCVGGFAAAVSDVSNALMFRAASHGEMALAGWLRVPTQLGWAVCGLTLTMVLPLYSPDGRLPSKRWRPALWLGCVAIGAATVRYVFRMSPAPGTTPFPAIIPNPLQIPALHPYMGVITTVSWAGIYTAMALAALSLAVRMRRADPAGRRQIGWPLLAFAGYIFFLILGAIWPVFMWPAIAWAAAIPFAVAFAVMRYRLYGIDTVISRAFVAAGVVVVVSLVYFGAGTLSSLVVSGYDQVAGVAAALFAGAFFQPLRRALQRAMDRLLYGAVGDPGLLAERLTQAVRGADPARALTSVVSVLRDGLAVEGVAVEVADGEPRYVESGRVGPDAREVPLVWHGARVGRLLVGPPGPRRFPAAHNERVLATLTPYAADVAHAVRMAADLQRSRERILTAREEERRRLRRDLHDGLGQTLSAMAMTINMARLSLKSSPEAADELLRELHAGMSAVTSDIRELVYGLRPPALDDLGLARAVRDLAARSSPGTEVEVEVEGDLEDLPAAVEVAVYRIVQEALTNIGRHAEASRARIVLQREESVLRVLVTDDGKGLPESHRAGVGLGSMRERAAELGGICVVTGEPGAGTRVEVMLPLLTAGPLART
ncbi:ATP-binding region, ATPase-like [[Actinomadura] parvosata subsp. kistnae]|uniref:Oxygen sensor histidine kinase NreB n=1 Tax=[Actinomadura] parvosata subsp. kistnae TaxID=1909395 RepID=A0A1V0AEA6_9ACTN|nr:sensor histidine kinase [Nonomuraea sp. ATCC 55076]AQZ68432.1 two-component sensor histidine kinase [Nonomuraea sp. ATCC 55076]SPL93122.1 ATP-binding region, ATPase-like [Actinomadura parvosata subsp. kistnae]